MRDMLVPLYNLSRYARAEAGLAPADVMVRRAKVEERYHVIEWARFHFDQRWAADCEVAFSSLPPKCFIATRGTRMIGLACYDASCLGYFGPTGVLDSERGQGIGRLLLVRTLRAMEDAGYEYAIIGGVGPDDFYRKTVGAILIEGSDPGHYGDMLPEKFDPEATS